MSSIVSSSTRSLGNKSTQCEFENNHSSNNENNNSESRSINSDKKKYNKDNENLEKRHSSPISTEPINGTNSIVTTKVSTDDTMSSSPSSYTSTGNVMLHVPSSTSISGSRIDRRSPVIQTPREGQDDDNNKVQWDDEINKNIKIYSDTNNTREETYMEKSAPNLENTLDSLNIVTLSTDRLIKMLTALLEKIVHSNDRLNSIHPTEISELDTSHDQTASLINSVLSFKGKHVPQIELEQYFHRVQKYCPTTNEVYLSLLIYFDRISKKCNTKLQDELKYSGNCSSDNELVEIENKELLRDDVRPQIEQEVSKHQMFVLDSYNIHRLIIAGITVSTKFFSDFFYSNSRYARVGGISLKEMNHLELQFLVLCDFELLISVEEMERYANLLYRFWDNDNTSVKKDNLIT